LFHDGTRLWLRLALRWLAGFCFFRNSPRIRGLVVWHAFSALFSFWLIPIRTRACSWEVCSVVQQFFIESI
jgi:hypothetical protein